MLGPLTNPASASCQILGVYSPDLTEMFAEALKLLGVEKAFVVHGHDGMDEMTTTDLTRVTELADGMIKTYDIDPLSYFEDYADPKDLLGGDVKQNAAITMMILKGETGPKQDIVLLNAGTGLVAADAAPTIEKGIELARQAIESGAALEKLEQLAAYTQENG